MRPAENVQDLIDLLHIDIIGAEMESKFDMIREDYEEFKAILTHFYQYAFAAWHHVDLEMPADMAYSRVQNILHSFPLPDARLSRIRSYLDNQGGYHQAIKNALWGRDGGLVKILDVIIESMKQEAVRDYVTAVFLDAVNPVSFDTKVRFMEEYIERYGHVVLPEEDLISPYELAAHMEAVIENHVNLVNQFRTRLQ